MAIVSSLLKQERGIATVFAVRRLSVASMDFLATLVVFSSLSAVAKTQVGLNISSTSLPVSYNPIILEGGPNEECAATKSREIALNTIYQYNQDIR